MSRLQKFKFDSFQKAYEPESILSLKDWVLNFAYDVLFLRSNHGFIIRSAPMRPKLTLCEKKIFLRISTGRIGLLKHSSGEYICTASDSLSKGQIV